LAEVEPHLGKENGKGRNLNGTHQKRKAKFPKKKTNKNSLGKGDGPETRGEKVRSPRGVKMNQIGERTVGMGD